MNSIEKIIFNELVSHRAVWLPEVGTLSVTFTSAKVAGKRQIVPPGNKVDFSVKRIQGARSIVDLLEDRGLDRERAKEIYHSWLANNKWNSVVIEGVGELSKGFFKPSDRLQNMLNPLAGQAIVVKSRKRYGLPLLIAAAAVVLVCAGIMLFFNIRSGNTSAEVTAGVPVAGTQSEVSGERAAAADANLPEAGSDDSVVQTPETSGQDQAGGEIAANNLAVGQNSNSPSSDISPVQTGVNPAGTTNSTEPVATTSGAKPAGTSTVATAESPRYYIVGGVFTVEPNADKYIAQMLRRFPDIEFEKVPFQRGKVMVSIFSTTDSDEADRARRRLSRQMNNYDLWIHKSSK